MACTVRIIALFLFSARGESERAVGGTSRATIVVAATVKPGCRSSVDARVISGFGLLAKKCRECEEHATGQRARNERRRNWKSYLARNAEGRGKFSLRRSDRPLCAKRSEAQGLDAYVRLGI